METNVKPAAAAKPSFFSKSNRKLIGIAIVVIIGIAAIVLVMQGGGGSPTGAQLSQFDNQKVPKSVLAKLIIPDNVSATVRTGYAVNFP